MTRAALLPASYCGHQAAEDKVVQPPSLAPPWGPVAAPPQARVPRTRTLPCRHLAIRAPTARAARSHPSSSTVSSAGGDAAAEATISVSAAGPASCRSAATIDITARRHPNGQEHQDGPVDMVSSGRTFFTAQGEHGLFQRQYATSQRYLTAMGPASCRSLASTPSTRLSPTPRRQFGSRGRRSSLSSSQKLVARPGTPGYSAVSASSAKTD